MAVLDATSVIVAVIIQIMTKIAKGGNTFRPANCAPNQLDKPDAFEASDKANPAPKQAQSSIYDLFLSLLIFVMNLCIVSVYTVYLTFTVRKD